MGDSVRWFLWLMAVLLAVVTASNLWADFSLSGQESEVYYRYAVAAGEEIKVEKDSQIIGNLHSNGAVELKKDSTITGDVSAVDDVESEGTISGTVTEGAGVVGLPMLLDQSGVLSIAERIFNEDTTFTDEVIDDVVYVDGKVRIVGSLNGVGTLIASGEVHFEDADGDSDSDSDSGQPHLEPDTRLSLMSAQSIKVGKGWLLRGALRSGQDVKLEAGVRFEGVLIADRKVHLKKDVVVTFLDFDQVSPEITLLEPEDGSLLTTSVPEIDAVFSDDYSGVRHENLELLLDGVDRVAEAEVSSSRLRFAPTEPLAEGLHTLEIVLSDHSDNQAREFASFRVDTVHPLVTIESPEEGQLLSQSNVEVSGTASDANRVVEVTVNGQPATLSADTFAATVALSQGSNTIVAVATDSVGRQGFATLTFTLDTEPPILELETPQSGQLTNEAALRFVGEAVDDQGVAAVEINGILAVLLGGRFDAQVALPEGQSTAVVRAFDLAGNVTEVAVDVRRLSIPSVTVTSPEDLSLVKSDSIVVEGTTTPGATVSVNGQPATVTGSTFTAEGMPLADGANIFDVVASGPGEGKSPAKVTVFRDQTPPRLTIYAPRDGQVVRQPTVVVQGLVNDISLGTTTERTRVTVAGTAAQMSNRSFLSEPVALAPGENVLAVIAVDPSGNVAQESVRVIYEPATGPGLKIDSGDLQSGPIGSVVSEPLTVRLAATDGAPLAGQPVFFKVTGDSGRLDGGRRQLVATTDASGRASAALTLGNRAGAGGQRVRVTAPGVVGGVGFHATALPGPPAHLFVDDGDQQTGLAGQNLPDPFVAVVTDAGFNRLEGVPVVFRTVRGLGTFAGGGNEMTLTSDAAGKAHTTLTLDAEEGVANHVVEAVLPDFPDVRFATFVASGRAGGLPAQTEVSGLVLDNTDLPVPAATVHIAGTNLSAETDADGLFRIPQAPVGSILLAVDGTTTTRPSVWPHLEFELTTIPGRDNTLGRPIYLLPLDVERGITVSETEGGALTLPELPGFSLEVEPGSVTFPDGSRSGVVSVTVVHNDKVPMVPNFGQQPRLVFSIQPGGAIFDPPARLTLPNVDGLEPGAVTEFYSFDHDFGSFVGIGPGTVSDDGLTVVSNPGVGVIEAGWHCGGNPTESGTPHDCPQCHVCDGSRCVAGCPIGSSVLDQPSMIAPPGWPALKAGCTCDDGDRCTGNDTCNGIACAGDKVKILSVSASVNGETSADVATGKPVVFTATAEHENCEEVTFEWVVRPLGPGGESAQGSTSSFTHNFITPGAYSTSVTASCGNCSSKEKSLALIVYDIEILLEKDGPTRISSDGVFSENVTITVTAVRSDTGAPLLDFAGDISLVEIGDPPVYSQNGGFLPSSVAISFSGKGTFVAKSLAGPVHDDGPPPPSAFITTENYALGNGDFFEIEQWVDEQQLDFLSEGPVYDWVEARALSVFSDASSTVLNMLARIENYRMGSPGDDPGNTERVHSPNSRIRINPHYLGMRLDTPTGNVCGQAKSRFFTNVLVHEGRHAYQNFLTTVDLSSPDQIDGMPNNDDDQDFLVESVPVPPSNIILDTLAFRDVCAGNGAIVPARFKGDGVPDTGEVLALEMDAHVFDSRNVN